MDKRKNLQETFKENVEELTIHGLPRISKSQNKFFKFFWCSFSIASVVLCGIFISQNVKAYFKFSYSSNIGFIYENPMQFPTVTFCSASYGFENKSLQTLLSSCLYENDNSCQINPDNFFESFRDPSYGKCYRFNSGKNMKGDTKEILNNKIAGRSWGFQFTIIEKKSLLVFIHDSSMNPYPAEDYNNLNGDSIYVPAGFSNDISVEKTIIKRLDSPYNDCLIDCDDFLLNKTIINYIKAINQTYTQQNCIRLCFDVNFLNDYSCNCSSTLGSVWSDCFKKVDDCTFTKIKAFYSNTNFISLCSEYCPLECYSTSYPSTLSLQVASSPPNFTSLKLKIYYRELKYSLITQSASYSVTGLVSNIGGILGLFLGMSFLSLVEIGEFFLKTFHACIHKTFSLSRANQISNQVEMTHQKSSNEI